MIRAIAKGSHGRALIVLGLSHDNVHRLFHGDPIAFSMESFEGPEGYDVLILVGATEQIIKDQLLKSASVPNEVREKVQVAPDHLGQMADQAKKGSD